MVQATTKNKLTRFQIRICTYLIKNFVTSKKPIFLSGLLNNSVAYPEIFSREGGAKNT